MSATHQYAITWDHGLIAFYQDDHLAGEGAVDGFAVPADAALFLGGDPTGNRAANATVQELAVWNRALPGAAVAAQAGNGQFIQRGAERVITLTVRVALATQGFTPTATKMQFSFDAQHWSDPEPYAPTKTLQLPPGAGDDQVYVRFTDNAGRSLVVVDHVIVIAPPAGSSDKQYLP
jgi:hypothetical protein